MSVYVGVKDHSVYIPIPAEVKSVIIILLLLVLSVYIRVVLAGRGDHGTGEEHEDCVD